VRTGDEDPRAAGSHPADARAGHPQRTQEMLVEGTLRFVEIEVTKRRIGWASAAGQPDAGAAAEDDDRLSGEGLVERGCGHGLVLLPLGWDVAATGSGTAQPWMREHGGCDTHGGLLGGEPQGGLRGRNVAPVEHTGRAPGRGMAENQGYVVG
jgi:hypothetical protein